MGQMKIVCEELMWENVKLREPFEILNVHWKIVLKYIFKNYDVSLERICLAHGKDKWREIVNALIISTTAGKFLNSCPSSYFPRKTLLNGFTYNYNLFSNLLTHLLTYLLTYFLTYLIHGAKSFFRN